MRAFVILLAVLLAVPAASGEINRIYINKARKFVAANPIIAEPAPTPRMAVLLSSRIAGLRNLVQLASLKVLPPDLLRPQLKRRIAIPRRFALRLADHRDPRVRGLAGLIGLHAFVAFDRLAGRTSADSYGDVARFAIDHGSYLAGGVTATYPSQLGTP